MYELIILFHLAAFLSIVVGTVAGFGTSTIFLPVALFFLDFQTALVLVAITHISGNIGAVGFFLRGLNKNYIIRTTQHNFNNNRSLSDNIHPSTFITNYFRDVPALFNIM